MNRLCFCIALLISAAVLFVVQPLVGRTLLPVLGGSPAVWNTCMVFFQGVLLAGYCYADLLARRLSLPWQVVAHGIVLAGAAIFLPVPTQAAAPEGIPTAWLLRTLATTVGPPFFALCATAPLVQRWFSGTTDRAARDPYFLYAASNAGSIGGLLLYPLVVEPQFTLRSQSLLVSVGYSLAAVAVVACGVLAIRRAVPTGAGPGVGAPPAACSHRRRLHLVALAAVPSSLVLGATQHLTTDVAAIPLLWVVPLALYLVTFMLAFASWPTVSADVWGRILPWASAPAVFFLIASAHHPLFLILAAHLCLLFVAGMMCHRRLYELRPDPARLTGFYLLISLGGVLGGLFNAIVAPQIFSSIVEYPLAIAALAWLRPAAEAGGEDAMNDLRRLIRPLAIAAAAGVAATLGADRALHAELVTPQTVGVWEPLVKPLVRGLPAVAVILVCACLRTPLPHAAALTAALVVLPLTGHAGDVLFQGRSFFGVHRVALQPSGAWVTLHHGSTRHGVQARRRPDSENLAMLSLQPTTYYARSGPIGDVIGLLADAGRLDSMAVIGLGAGTLAAYATPGMTLHFFEIDPLVAAIAADPNLFTYLADAAADKSIMLSGYTGDGRLRLAEQPARSYDLVVVDAFSSDSIPLHLITREAVALYFERLKPGGLIAFNVSNRYFDLAAPIGGIARDLGLTAAVRRDTEISQADREMAKHESVWAAVGDAAAIGALVRRNRDWQPIPVDASRRVWTDDYGNLLGALYGFGW